MEEKEARKIVKILSNDPKVYENWQNLFNGLKLSASYCAELEEKYKSGVVKGHDLFWKIIRTWISEKGSEATVQNLASVLENVGFKNAAEKVSKKFKGPHGQLKYVKVGKPLLQLQYNFQRPVANYISRTELEKEITEYLLQPKIESNCRYGFPIVILHGIGNNGKTTLARQIVSIFQIGDFLEGNSIWINAEYEETIVKDFSNYFETKSEKKSVLEKLKEQLFQTPCLLVFDNLTDHKIIRDYLPLNCKTGISVLVTSNSIWPTGDFGEVKHILVGKFTSGEFYTFQKNGIKSLNSKQVEYLAKKTGRIPFLTNVVCSGFVIWKKYYKDDDVRKYFKLNGDKILSGAKHPLMDLDYQKSPQDIVERQMNLIYSVYGEDGAIACKLLNILAYCKTVLNIDTLLNFIKDHRGFKITTNKLIKQDVEHAAKAGIEILIENGFLEKTTEKEMHLHKSYQHAIGMKLRSKNEEEEKEEIEQLITPELLNCNFLNIRKLWENGNKFGDPMLEKMVSSTHFICSLFQCEEMPDVKNLIDYAKNFKSKLKEVCCFLFGKQEEVKICHLIRRVQIFLGENLERFEEFFKDFREFIEVFKLSCLKEKENYLIEIFCNNSFQKLAIENVECLKILFKDFPKLLNAKFGDDQESFLHIAARTKKIEAVKYLIKKKKVDLNSIDMQGYTPLHVATGAGHFCVVDKLLKSGADKNIQDKEGCTALHHAAEWNFVEIVECLISNQVRIDLKNNKDQTALILASKNDHKKIVEILNLKCSDFKKGDKRKYEHGIDNKASKNKKIRK